MVLRIWKVFEGFSRIFLGSGGILSRYLIVSRIFEEFS